VPYPADVTAVTTDGATVVYTDGACRGNPGPGGWAWAVPGGAWGSGADPATTNQRMEIRAVVEALAAIDGPVLVRSDSTYVVHCWRDRWWEGWQRRGWRNSKKEPVANRDLWEPLVEQFATREGLRLEWVKGHGGDPVNDLVDRLAVRASHTQTGDGGEVPPSEDQLGPPDAVGTRGAPPAGAAAPAVRDGRVPAGWPLAVVGLRDEQLEGSAGGEDLRRRLAGVLQAQADLHPDLVVLTGLRAGTESVAADAATAAGVPYVAVLPYPDPTAGWSAGRRRSFEERVAGAREVVTLERRRPTDLVGRRSALSRRDGWLRSAAAAAVVVTDGEDAEAELLLRRFEEALGDEVWRLDL
jgi:ribonuclease HI